MAEGYFWCFPWLSKVASFVVGPSGGAFTGQKSFAQLTRCSPVRSKCVTHPLSYAKASPVVICGVESIEKEEFYLHRGLACKFSSLWPSLPDLHNWILATWKPIVAASIELDPYAKGFFIASFSSFEDKNQVLNQNWAWGEHFLSVKPWSPSFNPLSKPLHVRPVWFKLPHLPLQFWKDSYFEAIGNSMGCFLRVDDSTLNIGHTTFSHILVDINISKPLHGDVVMMVGDRPSL